MKVNAYFLNFSREKQFKAATFINFRFTGWTDVDLSEAGINEAQKAGRVLKVEGYR